MKAILNSCGAILLVVALLSVPAALAQSTAGQNTDSATASEIQQLRDALAAQQKQIAEQQARIDALSKQMQAQRPHAPNLGEVASTTPMVPAGSAMGEASLGQVEKSPAAAPPPSDSIALAQGKLKIGAVAYADWGYYDTTGYGPVFLDTPHIYPGPGNDGYNSFNLNRAYVNIVYAPTDWLSFRVTPDIYRDVNGAPGKSLDANSAVGSTTNGSLNLRLKYGYAEFSKIFPGAFKDDNIRFGQTTNPMIDWEEALYGYRFVSLVPWNFISLSSTYTGATINGPIKGPNGKQYVDYQIGVFNNANFHSYELAENKTVMARASFYPMGASSKYEGLGITGFIDYGYNNAAPAAVQTPVVRGSAMVHYESPHNGAQIAFEYMFGRNAFSTGNLFGGSAPPDMAGLSPAAPASVVGTVAKTILAGRGVKQRGFAVFGHANLGKSKWALFGTYQFFQPNTNIANDPLDFDRIVAGVSYKVNKNLRFAFDNQDVLYRRNGGTLTSAQLPDIKALFLNMEFSF